MCSAKNWECASVCMNIFVSACVCVCLIWKKLLEGRAETDIGKDRADKSAALCAYLQMWMTYRQWFSGFRCSWAQVRENNVSHSCTTRASFASGFVWNTPLLTSNSCIEVNWANPSSKGCLKFTKCGPCLTKRQVN